MSSAILPDRPYIYLTKNGPDGTYMLFVLVSVSTQKKLSSSVQSNANSWKKITLSALTANHTGVQGLPIPVTRNEGETGIKVIIQDPADASKSYAQQILYEDSDTVAPSTSGNIQLDAPYVYVEKTGSGIRPYVLLPHAGNQVKANGYQFHDFSPYAFCSVELDGTSSTGSTSYKHDFSGNGSEIKDANDEKKGIFFAKVFSRNNTIKDIKRRTTVRNRNADAPFVPS